MECAINRTQRSFHPRSKGMVKCETQVQWRRTSSDEEPTTIGTFTWIIHRHPGLKKLEWGVFLCSFLSRQGIAECNNGHSVLHAYNLHTKGSEISPTRFKFYTYSYPLLKDCPVYCPPPVPCRFSVPLLSSSVRTNLRT